MPTPKPTFDKIRTMMKKEYGVDVKPPCHCDLNNLHDTALFNFCGFANLKHYNASQHPAPPCLTTPDHAKHNLTLHRTASPRNTSPDTALFYGLPGL